MRHQHPQGPQQPAAQRSICEARFPEPHKKQQAVLPKARRSIKTMSRQTILYILHAHRHI